MTMGEEEGGLSLREIPGSYWKDDANIWLLSQSWNQNPGLMTPGLHAIHRELDSPSMWEYYTIVKEDSLEVRMREVLH
jgi:hypothetical protein